MISPMKLKYAASINDEALPEATAPDYELQYIDIGNVDSNGTIHDVVTYAFENAPSRARRIVKHGDVIVSTVRTYLQAIAAIENPPENLIVSTGFAVIRPSSLLHPKFCKYALLEPAFIHEVVSRSVGISYPAINASELGDIQISLPSFMQQEQIANFLDCETARIDSLIAAKENYLNLVAEKRRALITTAVTRGIDPTVQLTDSGISWLGPVPEHWGITRAKNLFREIDLRSSTGEETLLSLRMQQGLVPHNDVSEKLIPSGQLIGYKKAEPSQIVVNRMRAASGLIAIVPQTGIVSPDYAVFEPKSEVNPEYYTYLFTTPLFQAVFRSESKGLGTGSSGFLRLYSDNFLSISMPKPPTAEQSVISAYIQTETAKLDALKAATERTISLLRERRVALIAAAVAGVLNRGQLCKLKSYS